MIFPFERILAIGASCSTHRRPLRARHKASPASSGIAHIMRLKYHHFEIFSRHEQQGRALVSLTNSNAMRNRISTTGNESAGFEIIRRREINYNQRIWCGTNRKSGQTMRAQTGLFNRIGFHLTRHSGDLRSARRGRGAKC
jgi:hypothetical protein